jgi:uncharacterized protein YlzI (FlbEa/FlbD family)
MRLIKLTQINDKAVYVNKYCVNIVYQQNEETVVRVGETTFLVKETVSEVVGAINKEEQDYYD